MTDEKSPEGQQQQQPAPEAVKPAPHPSLRPSLLSAQADAIWAKSKLNFAASGGSVAMGSVKLKTRTFSDVAKASQEKAAREELAAKNRPKFIFGQNIAARVQHSDGSVAVPTAAETAAPKTAQELFRECAASKGDKNGIVAKTYEEFKKEAEEAAAKQKEAHEKQIPTTSLIDVKTGEEEDQVIFHTACKLHVFDKAQKRYVEKGMSTVKINKRVDDEGEHHRIIARTTGIHRLVINSKIFPDMLLERVDQKRLKISAMGAEEQPSIQVFLITIGFTHSDLSIEGLHHTLHKLIERSKEENKSRKRKNLESVENVEAKKPTAEEAADEEEKKTEDARQELEASAPFKSGGFEEKKAEETEEKEDDEEEKVEEKKEEEKGDKEEEEATSA